MSEFDLIIIGGGCSGLSLGRKLAEASGNAPRTLILEGRSAYSNDRTWCFWRDDLLACQSMVKHEWRALRVASGEDEIILKHKTRPYQMLSANTFYRTATEAIDGSNLVTLMMNTSVKSNPFKAGGKWVIETGQDQFTAPLVIDTRPKTTPKCGDAILWQSFVGYEIECDEDVFDPNLAELMDFSPPLLTRVQFTYVLPTTRKRALIELTVFAPDPFNSHVLQDELDKVIKQKFVGTFAILRQEQGILPMGMAWQEPDSDKSYVRVGLTSGGARASTGYAFQRIQRWAAMCAARLFSGSGPIGHAPDPLPLRMMDRLFLRVLKANSRLAPHMFMSLFKGVETERVIRFLSDQGTPMDYAKIILSLPPRPFLTELFRLSPIGSSTRNKAVQP